MIPPVDVIIVYIRTFAFLIEMWHDKSETYAHRLLFSKNKHDEWKKYRFFGLDTKTNRIQATRFYFDQFHEHFDRFDMKLTESHCEDKKKNKDKVSTNKPHTYVLILVILKRHYVKVER